MALQFLSNQSPQSVKISSKQGQEKGQEQKCSFAVFVKNCFLLLLHLLTLEQAKAETKIELQARLENVVKPLPGYFDSTGIAARLLDPLLLYKAMLFPLDDAI